MVGVSMRSGHSQPDAKDRYAPVLLGSTVPEVSDDQGVTVAALFDTMVSLLRDEAKLRPMFRPFHVVFIVPVALSITEIASTRKIGLALSGKCVGLLMSLF